MRTKNMAARDPLADSATNESQNPCSIAVRKSCAEVIGDGVKLRLRSFQRAVRSKLCYCIEFSFVRSASEEFFRSSNPDVGPFGT